MKTGHKTCGVSQPFSHWVDHQSKVILHHLTSNESLKHRLSFLMEAGKIPYNVK